MVKNLNYFMREPKDEIVKALGPETIKDENGKVIEFEIKVLSQATLTKINDNYETKSIATDKKGNPLVVNGEVVWKIEKDSARAVRHVIAEALVYPDLKNPELMDFYKCNDISEMPLLVFPKSEEYNHVLKIVYSALGIGDYGKDDIKTENDIDEAKN